MPQSPSPPEPYFQTRSFAQVIEDGSNEPLRRKIGGAFLYENTTHYFFSRTNYGKSFFAFQFAYAAATGTSIAPCVALQNECEPMKVVVVDLEMDSKTIFDRHKLALRNTDPELLKNLVFLHEKLDQKIVIGLEMLEKIEQAAIGNKAKLIVIDNISKLLPDSLKPDLVTMVISSLNRIREKTGAAILVIGHTTKGDVRTAISPTSYYGSAMVQNFFTEMFFLDATKDGRFFLCHAKTKREECYSQTVPVFTRGAHPSCGIGFTFEQLQSITDVQLPLTILTSTSTAKRNLSKYRDEITMLSKAGIRPVRIAELCGVHRSSISRLLEESP
jgi:hypothetical protein